MSDQCTAEFIVNHFKKEDQLSHTAGFNCLKTLVFNRIRALTQAASEPHKLAEDLFMEFAFLFFENVETGKFEYKGEHQFIGYFYRVLKRWWNAWIKKYGHVIPWPEGLDIENDVEVDLGEMEENQKRKTIFKKCFDELSAECQRIYFFLFRYRNEKVSFKELAVLLEESKDPDDDEASARVRNRWQRCKKQLKKCVESYL